MDNKKVLCVKFFCIGKGILFVIGMVFSATLGYSGREKMSKYSQRIPDETWERCSKTHSRYKPRWYIKEKIKEKLGIDPDNVCRITYESITAVLKTCCDQRTKDVIKCFESMLYAGCCEEAERWVDSKELPPQDADRLKTVLKKLMEYPNWFKSFKLALLLEQVFYDGKIRLEKVERNYCSLLYTYPTTSYQTMATMRLSFSPIYIRKYKRYINNLIVIFSLL